MKTEEKIILLQVLDILDGQGYGVTIYREFEKRAGRFTSIGEIYATLSDLEEAGLVRSTLIPGGAERGYRQKKVWWRA